MKAGRREENMNDLPAFLPSCGLSLGKVDHHPAARRQKISRHVD
jgi:hypothetical protein